MVQWESSRLNKIWSLKYVYILDNVINIFLFNYVLFHPPATHPLLIRMLIIMTRPTRSAYITTICASQIYTDLF